MRISVKTAKIRLFFHKQKNILEKNKPFFFEDRKGKHRVLAKGYTIIL